MTENTASTASTPLSPEDLLAIYDVPGASAAEFLCDRHDPDAVAFTVIDPDLSGRDITYGELRTESEKVAAAELLRVGQAEQADLAELGEQPLGVGVVPLVFRGDRLEELVRDRARHLEEFVRLVAGEQSVHGHGGPPGACGKDTGSH